MCRKREKSPPLSPYVMIETCCLGELKRVVLVPKYPHKLASVEEVLGLKPELRPPKKNFLEGENPRCDYPHLRAGLDSHSGHLPATFG